MIEDYEDELKKLAGPCLPGGLIIDFLGRPQFEVLVNRDRISAATLYRWIHDS
jgi:hypothetical protein